jgi:hypothetical protein
MEVTLKVEKEKEEGFFKDLSQLGKVQKVKEGFRDGDGNIVLILKKSTY